MEEQEEVILVVCRLADLVFPGVDSTIVKCHRCQTACWQGNDSHATMSKFPNYEIVCQQCIAATFMTAQPEEIEMRVAATGRRVPQPLADALRGSVVKRFGL